MCNGSYTNIRIIILHESTMKPGMFTACIISDKSRKYHYRPTTLNYSHHLHVYSTAILEKSWKPGRILEYCQSSFDINEHITASQNHRQMLLAFHYLAYLYWKLVLVLLRVSLAWGRSQEKNKCFYSHDPLSTNNAKTLKVKHEHRT